MTRTLAVLVLALGLSGCASTTAVVPNPPQVTIAKSIGVLDVAANAAVTAAIQMRSQGTVSPADVTTIENYAKLVLQGDQLINAILGNGQTITQQKAAILGQLATVIAPKLATTINPNMQALVQAVANLYAALEAQVSAQ